VPLFPSTKTILGLGNRSARFHHPHLVNCVRAEGLCRLTSLLRETRLRGCQHKIRALLWPHAFTARSCTLWLREQAHQYDACGRHCVAHVGPPSDLSEARRAAIAFLAQSEKESAPRLKRGRSFGPVTWEL
jgi:hypothetical protein